MIKALISTRMHALFASIFKSSKREKKRGLLFKILIALLVIYVVGALLLVFGMLFFSLCTPLADAGLGWLYFAFVGIACFAFCFIGSIFTAQTQIFEAQDNDLLLSMPISPMAILLSRLSSLLILNYVYELLIAIPAGVIWCMFQPVTPAGVVFYVISMLLLPLLALTFSCFFGWLISIITSKMRRREVFMIVLYVAFLLLYLQVYSNMTGYIEALVAHGAEIATAIQRYVFPMYHMGRAVADGNLISMLTFMLCNVIPFLVVIWILSRNFIKIATTSRRVSKIKYREKALRVSGSQSALLKKDFRHFFAHPMYILNSAVGCVFMVIIAVMASTNSDFFLAYGITQAVPSLITLVLCASAAMTTISAPSISLEGKHLWVSKSLPVQTYQILISKVYMHLIVTLPFCIIASTICAIFIPATPLQIVSLYLIPVVFSVLVAFIGLHANLRFPKFDWISETHAVKQSVSVVIAMFGSIAVAGLFVILYFVLPHNISADMFMLICAVPVIIASLLLNRSLKTTGARRFESF